MAKRKITKKNFDKVLDSIKENFKNESNGGKDYWVDCMNNMLDDMRDEDFFGTEGQLDPRGDNRD